MCKCIISSKKLFTMLCVIDFTGFIEPGHFTTSYWADYDKVKHVVHFGGDWSDIKHMKTSRLPSSSEVAQYVTDYRKKHENLNLMEKD